MRTATGWHSATCLTVALLVCFAHPLRAAPAAQEGLQQAMIAQAGTTAAQNGVVAAEARIEAKRAAQGAAKKPPVAVASIDQAAPTESDDHWVWDETPLIGKILIGIGTLLALTSAARMLMA
jgi:hypothetical protein